MSHISTQLVSYQRIPSWDADTKLARPSKCKTFLCKNGIGDLTHSFCFHTLGMHCHRGSNHPLIQKYKTYTYFDRTARQKG